MYSTAGENNPNAAVKSTGDDASFLMAVIGYHPPNLDEALAGEHSAHLKNGIAIGSGSALVFKNKQPKCVFDVQQIQVDLTR